MPERHLPDRPNLDQLKHQAKDLLRDLRRGEPSASAAFQKHHPERPDARTAKLADAQFVVARSYGAPTWPRLVLACHIIDAIWRNDGETVRDLALKEPAVLHTILASPRGQTLLQSRFAIRQLLQSVAGHVRPPRGAVMGAAEPLNARGLSYFWRWAPRSAMTPGTGAHLLPSSSKRIRGIRLESTSASNSWSVMESNCRTPRPWPSIGVASICSQSTWHATSRC